MTEVYRWKVFESAEQIAIFNNVDEIYILGDTTDRKDRHGASLVNKFVDALVCLHDNTGAEIFILMGNHDAPLQGRPFWNFLNKLGIYYITQPCYSKDVLLLPFSNNPLEDWKELKLFESAALMMHQTIAGAVIERNRIISTDACPMPVLPRMPIFSGDIHRPQRIGAITYVGASHPVRFGEDWRCRALLIHGNDWANPIEVPLPHIRRQILDLDASTNAKDLDYLKQDDQVRIRWHMTKAQLSDWPIQKEVLQAWANGKGVQVLSMEAKLEDTFRHEDAAVVQREIASPEQVIRDFGLDQKLDELTISTGLELIKEVS